MIQRAVYRYGAHGQRVYLISVETGKRQAEGRGAVNGVIGKHGIVVIVGHSVLVALHAAIRAPAEGQRVACNGVYAVHAFNVAAGGRDDQAVDLADLVRIGFNAGAAHEVNVGVGIADQLAVLGMRGHGDGIAAVGVQLQQRHGDSGHLRILAVGVYRAFVVGDADVVAFNGAAGEPGDIDAAIHGVAVADLIQAILEARVGAQHDLRIADLFGHIILGSLGAEQIFERVGVSLARLLHAGQVLEVTHHFLGLAVEIAVRALNGIAERLEAFLHLGNAVVIVAAAQRDVTAVFRRAACKQLLLHGGGRNTGLLEAHFLLEAAQRLNGSAVVAAADLAFEVVQLFQALVQLAHAIAGIAPSQVNVAGAAGSGIGIELAQRFGIGHAGLAEVVFGLEQLHGGFGAHAEDAVRVIGQIAQVAQPLLHFSHAQAAVANRKPAIGVVGGQLAGENIALKRFVCSAGHGIAELGLRQLYGALGAPAENAVDIVVVIAQVMQRLLNGGNRIAAAAAPQRGILFRRLEQVGNRLFILDLVGTQQYQARRAVRHILRGGINEREGGQRVGFAQHAVDIQLAADGLNTVAVQLLTAAYGIALERRQRCKAAQIAGGGVYGVDLVVLPEHEELVIAGSQLRIYVCGLGDGLPEHIVRIEALERQRRRAAGKVINGVVDDRPVLHAGIHQRGREGAVFLHIQAVGVGQVDLERVIGVDALGNIAAVGHEAAAHRILYVRACAVLHRADDAVAANIHALKRLAGREGSGRAAAIQAVGAQLRAVRTRNVIHRVLIQAGRIGIVRYGGLGKAVQVQAHQVALSRTAIREEQNAVSVDGDDPCGLGGVHRRAYAGDVDVAVAIHKGGQLAVARNHVALTVRTGGKGGHADEGENQDQ